MKKHVFLNGLTVKELKDILADWSETDEDGNPCEIWICNDEGFSNQVHTLYPLNKCRSDDNNEVVWADVLFKSKLE